MSQRKVGPIPESVHQPFSHIANTPNEKKICFDTWPYVVESPISSSEGKNKQVKCT